MRSVWSECYRVLTVGGRICINIDATTNVETDVQDLVHPLHVDTTNILREIGYRYRGEIIWTKQNSPGSPTAWGSYCSCSNPRFKRNTEYVILAYKEQSLLEGDPMFCDLTKDEFHKWTLTEWRISPETGGYGHPVPFPRELVARCIKMFSYVGNTVLDPFCGSGTTPVTALEFGRHFVGIDNSEDYCRKAKSRIEEAKRHMLCCGSDDPDARTYNGYTWIPSPIHQKRARERKKSAPSRDLFV
jgi:site-specific DNA-methyltransferase (adenine-specific)